MKMCITSEDTRAMEETAVLDLLCEACVRKVEAKLQYGQTLSYYRLDEYGFCQECSKQVDALLKRMEAEELAEAERTSSPPRPSE
jgi:hypothetical protein